MKYEAHITFFEPETIPARELNRLMDVTERAGGHVLMIQLLGDNPTKIEHPLQIMLSRKVELYNDSEAENWICYLSNVFVAAEFKPVRVKLEAEMGQGPAKYWEAHWKVQKTVYYGGGIHFSRSLQDRNKYWATARMRGTSSLTAAEVRFDDIRRELGKAGLLVPDQKEHHERVILDTNPALDNGWAQL